MKTHFPTLRGLLIRLKLYMSRTGSYISLVNTAMILFIFLSDLEKYNIDIEIRDTKKSELIDEIIEAELKI